MISTRMNKRGKKKRRDFYKKGDLVNFELDTTESVFRWSGKVDLGPSGVYVNGVIHEKTQEYYDIYSVLPNGELYCFKIPSYSSNEYSEEQWRRDGFVLKWKTEDIDVDCECGYGNDSNLHFIFCPRHPKSNTLYTKDQLKEKLTEMTWYTLFEIEDRMTKSNLEKK